MVSSVDADAEALGKGLVGPMAALGRKGGPVPAAGTLAGELLRQHGELQARRARIAGHRARVERIPVGADARQCVTAHKKLTRAIDALGARRTDADARLAALDGQLVEALRALAAFRKAAAEIQTSWEALGGGAGDDEADEDPPTPKKERNAKKAARKARPAAEVTREDFLLADSDDSDAAGAGGGVDVEDHGADDDGSPFEEYEDKGVAAPAPGTRRNKARNKSGRGSV